MIEKLQMIREKDVSWEITRCLKEETNIQGTLYQMADQRVKSFYKFPDGMGNNHDRVGVSGIFFLHLEGNPQYIGLQC